MLKPISLYLLLLFLSVGCSAGDAQTPEARTYESFFDTSFGEFDQELEVAREQGKKGIMFFFDMRGCPYCQRMKDHVLNQASVQAYFGRHFLRFSVDIEGGIEVVDFAGKELSEKQFAVQQRVFATPLILFVDLQGKEIARYQGATSGVAEFLQLGAFVAEGAYKTQSFAQYKARKRAGGTH